METYLIKALYCFLIILLILFIVAFFFYYTILIYNTISNDFSEYDDDFSYSIDSRRDLLLAFIPFYIWIYSFVSTVKGLQ